MSLLCAMFGHKPPFYHEYEGGRYMSVDDYAYPDGVNRPHAGLWGECPRCGRSYKVGMAHMWGQKDTGQPAPEKSRQLLEIKPTMVTETETAIKFLAGKISGDIKPDEALKYSQSALNLAHVLATLNSLKK